MKYKVLYSGSIETYIEEVFCREFIRLLLQKGLFIETTVNALVTDLGVYESSLADNETYDFIIAFNEIGYVWIEHMHRPGIPAVYVLPGSNYKDSAANYEDFENVIFLNSDKAIAPEERSLHRINFPFFVEKNPVFNSQMKKNITVCVDNKALLLRLLLILNTLKDYNITVVAEQERFQVITNRKITFRATEKNLNALIAQSGLLIADKYFALKGIYSYKPVIVVGECGYGGLVTSENCMEHFESGFMGNNGIGEEYLLLQRVYADIESALECPKDELQTIIDLIKPEAKKQEEVFNSILTSLCDIVDRKYLS